jgi:hypothetical protein
MPTEPPNLLDRFRNACHRRGYRRPAVREDSSWTPRFVRFHGTSQQPEAHRSDSFVRFSVQKGFWIGSVSSRISEFRRKHLAELEDLFLEVLQICERMGLVEPGKVAFDRTRVQANARKHRAMSDEQMLQEKERLKEKSQERRERAEATGREEDEGFDGRADETNSPKS